MYLSINKDAKQKHAPVKRNTVGVIRSHMVTEHRVRPPLHNILVVVTCEQQRMRMALTKQRSEVITDEVSLRLGSKMHRFIVVGARCRLVLHGDRPNVLRYENRCKFKAGVPRQY